MSKQNFSVKAILRTDKVRKDGSCPINYRVTISSIIVKLPSGQYSEISICNFLNYIFEIFAILNYYFKTFSFQTSCVFHISAITENFIL